MAIASVLIRQTSAGNFPIERDIVVQVRSRHEGVRARMVARDSHSCQITWIDDWAPVSPGQAAVMYDDNNEELLCGGRISASES